MLFLLTLGAHARRLSRVSVCLSVTAVAASACVHSGHKRYTRISRRLFLDLTGGFSKNASVPEIWPKKSNI